MVYQSYRDLEIYKLAHKLCIEVHALSLTLPRHELYEEGSQIRRSSKSISANIVEGFGLRRYKNEFIKYLAHSLASCDETREHLDILFETQSLKDRELYVSLTQKYDELGRMLNAFIRSVEFGHRTRDRC